MKVSTIAVMLIAAAAPLPADEQRSGSWTELGQEFSRGIRPLLARYCIDCHGGDEAKAKIDLQSVGAPTNPSSDLATWKRVWGMMHAREMPPAGEPQPTGAERAQLNHWLRRVLTTPAVGQPPNPGHVVARRLNQVEYNNSLFELFGFNRPPTYFDPQRGMPEQVRLVLHRLFRPVIVDLPPDDVGYGFDNIGEILSLPPFLMEKYLAAARQVTSLAMLKTPPARGDVRYRSAVFNRLRQSGDESRGAAKSFIGTFACRAFRRRVEEAEIERYLRLFDAAKSEGATFEESVAAAVQAVLVSPHFLFRIEQGDAAREEQGVRPLTDFELAARLSYFLWSSTPDDELLRVAEAGELRNPAVLEAQARRMLRSRKAKELAENFALQWLQVKNIAGAMPDPDRFPQYYRGKYLPEALRQETLLLFETILVEDRSVLELVDADYSWLNLSLGMFYGLDPAQAGLPDNSLFWVRAPLPDKRRGGVLTMGSTLLATSSPARTSPVKRGKWILETILGAPPPPPLDNVPDLDSTPAAEDGLALREKLARHRSDAACASCHQRMDPLGLSLENYDAIGAWRDREGPLPIDATGTMSDGSRVCGPAELKQLVVGERRDDFVCCLTQHMLTYALGRKLEHYDLGTIHQIAERVADDHYRLSRLAVEIALSYPFRYLQTEEVPGE
jgi:hypothetical protein